MFLSNSMLLLVTVLGLVQALDMVEGSGDDEIIPVISTKKSDSARFSEFIGTYRNPMNATLQLELVHAANHFSKGAIGLTVWLRLQWSDAKFRFTPFTGASGETVDMVILPIDDENLVGLEQPNTVIKNAMYYKQVASPEPHSYIAIFANGTIFSHQKVMVDLPCRLEFITDTTNGRRTRHQWLDVCALEYGSFVRSRRLLRLHWHQNAFMKNSVECSAVNGKLQSPACELQSTATYSKTAMQLNEPFDELFAELRFLRLQ